MVMKYRSNIAQSPLITCLLTLVLLLGCNSISAFNIHHSIVAVGPGYDVNKPRIGYSAALEKVKLSLMFTVSASQNGRSYNELSSSYGRLNIITYVFLGYRNTILNGLEITTNVGFSYGKYISYSNYSNNYPNVKYQSDRYEAIFNLTLMKLHNHFLIGTNWDLFKFDQFYAKPSDTEPYTGSGIYFNTYPNLILGYRF